MPRFFVETLSPVGETVRIGGDDAFHIARSLRMAAGDTLTVSDGKGTDALCRLDRIRDDEVLLTVLERFDGKGESPVRVTLFMAYPKGDKLETVIQKAVELGADRIVPFESSRCIKRPKADKIDKQTARLSRIAEEAAKQCGRSRLPEVAEPIPFERLLAQAGDFDLPLFCYEAAGTRPLKALLTEHPAASSVAVVVGCEGGFSEEEAAAAERAGFLLTGLGTRILRCETAPAYVLSSISYQFEL